jgi:hypothetical protein
MQYGPSPIGFSKPPLRPSERTSQADRVQILGLPAAVTLRRSPAVHEEVLMPKTDKPTRRYACEHAPPDPLHRPRGGGAHRARAYASASVRGGCERRRGANARGICAIATSRTARRVSGVTPQRGLAPARIPLRTGRGRTGLGGAHVQVSLTVVWTAARRSRFRAGLLARWAALGWSPRPAATLPPAREEVSAQRGLVHDCVAGAHCLTRSRRDRSGLRVCQEFV